ncbi:VWA domain-containing protein [Candidatus Hodarchaeum mangrovi]
MSIILNFVARLRYYGLAISPAETIMAQNAYQLIGVRDKNNLCLGLRATLVKRHQDIKIFNHVFQLFFGNVVPIEDTSHNIERYKKGEMRFLNRLRNMNDSYLLLGQALLEGRIEDAHGIATQINIMGEGTIGSGGSGGSGFTKSLILNLQRLFRLSFGIPVPIHGLTSEQRDSIPLPTLNLANNLYSFELEMLSAQELQQPVFTEPMADNISQTNQFLDYDLNYISTSVSNVKQQLIEIGHILASRERRKRKQALKGKVDFRRTFRRNLVHGGTPINLMFRKKKKQDPEIIILNDVSGSTSWAASWFFVICYAARNVFRKIRIFEFDNTTVDVTKALELKTIDRALFARQNCWKKTIRPRRIHSDYQSSFEDLFKLVNVNSISRKASILLLGDCRDNEGTWRSSGPISAELLEKLVLKVKKVLILNPESKALWNTGDSIVNYYQNVGANVFQVSTIRDLARLIFELEG